MKNMHRQLEYFMWLIRAFHTYSKPQVNKILGYLVSCFTLLIIYLGLTVNPGYSYANISHCIFLNPGLMFLFAYLWFQSHWLDESSLHTGSSIAHCYIIYCLLYYQVFTEWTFRTINVGMKLLSPFDIFPTQMLKLLFIGYNMWCFHDRVFH